MQRHFGFTPPPESELTGLRAQQAAAKAETDSLDFMQQMADDYEADHVGFLRNSAVGILKGLGKDVYDIGNLAFQSQVGHGAGPGAEMLNSLTGRKLFSITPDGRVGFGEADWLEASNRQEQKGMYVGQFGGQVFLGAVPELMALNELRAGGSGYQALDMPAEIDLRASGSLSAVGGRPQGIGLTGARDAPLVIALRENLAARRAAGAVNGDLGPSISVAMDNETGQMSAVYINNLEGQVPEDLNSILGNRLSAARDIRYIATAGAGSHSEVYAVNQLLNARPGAQLDQITVYTQQVGTVLDQTIKVPCPHCTYILEGVVYGY